MVKVLIATIWKADPVLVAAHQLSPDRLILLTNENPAPEQQEAVKLIKDSIGRVISVETVRIAVYDIVETATKVVEIIDHVPHSDEIYVSIIGGRKTQAIAALMAAYARTDRVKKIVYIAEEDKTRPIYLPLMSFSLSKGERDILDTIGNSGAKSIAELAKDVKVSRAMLYRAVKELKDRDLVELTNDGLKLTDAGKIARL